MQAIRCATNLARRMRNGRILASTSCGSETRWKKLTPLWLPIKDSIPIRKILIDQELMNSTPPSNFSNFAATGKSKSRSYGSLSNAYTEKWPLVLM